MIEAALDQMVHQHPAHERDALFSIDDGSHFNLFSRLRDGDSRRIWMSIQYTPPQSRAARWKIAQHLTNGDIIAIASTTT